MNILEEYEIDNDKVDWKEDIVGVELYQYGELSSNIHEWQIENNKIQSGADPYDLEGIFILKKKWIRI